jgi:mannose-6-phosphate isomerase-like protein (cupin superfamily)
MTQTIDYTKWMNQPLIWGERTRARGLVWTAESDWFINDPLGHKPHLHEDAGEILFLAQGSMEIEAGGSKQIYQAGDFLLVPPDKYHDYWFRGQDAVCLFVVVAPNHKHRRWKTSDFPQAAHEGEISFVNVYEADELPSDEFFTCAKTTLLPGEQDATTQLELQDRIIYVLSGSAQMTVNSLTGPLAPHQYQYIPATCTHQIRNSGYAPLTYISLIITDPMTAKGTEPAE